MIITNNNSLDQLSVPELVCHAQAGSDACFNQLVNHFSPRLLNYLKRKTHSIEDAEDLLQDAFLKAYQNLHRYQPQYAFSTWLFTIATRLTQSHYRKKHPITDDNLPEPTTQHSTYDLIAEHEQNTNLWNLARTLTPLQFDTLWLKYTENFSIKQIAQTLDKSQIHIKVTLHRARKAMMKKLQNQQPTNSPTKLTLKTKGNQ